MENRFLFRVWDKKEKEMHYRDLGAYCSSFMGMELCCDYAVLMQCTGKKDKNSALIFDGDILEYRDEFGVVEFSEACCWLTIDNVTTQLSEFYDYEIEIIGNVHDNPELIETT